MNSSTDTVATTLADHSLVLVAPNGTVLRGNHTAASLWCALQRSTSADEAAARVSRQYHAPFAQVRHDLDALLRSLQQAGIEVPHQ